MLVIIGAVIALIIGIMIGGAESLWLYANADEDGWTKNTLKWITAIIFLIVALTLPFGMAFFILLALLLGHSIGRLVG